jgi:hypothetical protein
MTVDYYHLSPVILSDDLFFLYRPDCMVTGTAVLRNAAYISAEQKMIQSLGTFLSPTTVTGSYVPTGNPLVLEYDRIISINGVTYQDLEGDCTCVLDPEAGCGLIRGGYGYIDVIRTSALAGRCGCHGSFGAYRVDVSFTAGIPTGTAANDANLHIALAMAAELELKEILDPGALEGGAGDPGVQSFSTEGYSETRVKLRNTPFGSSALANHIQNRVSHLRRKRALRF